MLFSDLLLKSSNGLKRWLISSLLTKLALLITACGSPSTNFSDVGVSKTITESTKIAEEALSPPAADRTDDPIQAEEEVGQVEEEASTFAPEEEQSQEQTERSQESSDALGDSGNSGGDGSQTYEQLLLIELPDTMQVDILWVIDSSLSMAEEQDYLGNNFSSFIAALANSNEDFQTAVTTTDICHDEMPDDLNLRACPFAYGGNSDTHLRGSFVGDEGRKVLMADDMDLEDKFREYTNVGTNGSNFEHGLRASSLAVEKALNGENEALMREGGFLSVIIISDEQDDGVGLSQFDPFLNFNPSEEGYTNYSYTNDELINYLNGIKGQGNFSISTITGTRLENGELCTSAHSSPSEEGSALIDAATKTGGIVLSICDTDWGVSLQDLGNDLNAQISQIHLEKQAVESSIEVQVDDAIYEKWSYIKGNNSVKFDSDAIPEPGSTIQISYDSLEP